MVAAAIGGSAVASIAGSAISGSAASSAASEQAAAANQAAQLQEKQYEQTRTDLLPYNTTGQSALNTLNSQLPSLTAPFSMTQAQLEQTPGYQFNLKQGLESTQNAAAARGLGVSGAALKGAASYATGLADSTYQNQYNDYLQQQTNAYNKLYGVASLGENAAATSGNIGQQGAAAAGNSLTQAGNALAAGTVGAGNAYASGLGSVGNSLLSYNLLNQFGGNGGVDPAGAAGAPGGWN